jgi:hypothetical protein
VWDFSRIHEQVKRVLQKVMGVSPSIYEFSSYEQFLRNKLPVIVKFEVFTAMIMKNIVFWDVARCGSGVNRRFGGTYRLHLQGR